MFFPAVNLIEVVWALRGGVERDWTGAAVCHSGLTGTCRTLLEWQDPAALAGEIPVLLMHVMQLRLGQVYSKVYRNPYMLQTHFRVNLGDQGQGNRSRSSRDAKVKGQGQQ